MEHLKPDHYSPGVRQLDFGHLARQGRVHVCLDLDNTLALRDAWEPAEGVAEALAEARRQGHVQQFCLVSNVIWGKKRRDRLVHFSEILEIPHYVPAMFWNRKPSPGPFREAMRLMGSEPATTAIVGDQIFTDIAGGRKLGLYGVLVKPLGPDHWTTLFSARRLRELEILRRYGLIQPEETHP